MVSYIDWLSDPNREYMPKGKDFGVTLEKLANILQGLDQKQNAETNKNQCALDSHPSQGIGSLKNCCRRKITSFWNGTFNPVNALNPVLEVTARIFHFEAVGQTDAVDLLEEYVWAIPEHARSCSDRLAKRNCKAISKDILRAVKAAYDGNARQKDIATSTRKLDKSVRCWTNAGFTLSDKSTWGICWCGFSKIPDIDWTEQDRKDIGLWLPPAIGEQHREIVADVAQGMVKIVAVEDAQENGMGYTYWQDFGDEVRHCMPEPKQNVGNLESMQDLELIEVHSKPIWFVDDDKTGMATIYRPGKRVESKLSSPAKAVCGQGRALRPTQASDEPFQGLGSAELLQSSRMEKNSLYRDL